MFYIHCFFFLSTLSSTSLCLSLSLMSLLLFLSNLVTPSTLLRYLISVAFLQCPCFTAIVSTYLAPFDLKPPSLVPQWLCMSTQFCSSLLLHMSPPHWILSLDTSSLSLPQSSHLSPKHCMSLQLSSQPLPWSSPSLSSSPTLPSHHSRSLDCSPYLPPTQLLRLFRLSANTRNCTILSSSLTPPQTPFLASLAYVVMYTLKSHWNITQLCLTLALL